MGHLVEVETEQNTLGSRQQRWSEIYKRKPIRNPSLESDVGVPLMQALGIGFLTATSVFMFFLVLTTVQLAIVVAAAALTFTSTAYAWFALGEVRETVYQVEEYSAEDHSSRRQEQASVRIEVIQNPHPTPAGQLAVGGRIVWEELNVSYDDLALAAQANELSKRALVRLGMNESTAMVLVRQLIERGYAARQQANRPAVWTAKGRALARALSQEVK